MKLILATLVFASCLFFAPDYFTELTAQMFQLEEKIIRILKFLIMLGGAIAFVAFTPIEWIKRPRWFKWGKMKSKRDNYLTFVRDFYGFQSAKDTFASLVFAIVGTGLLGPYFAATQIGLFILAVVLKIKYPPTKLKEK